MAIVRFTVGNWRTFKRLDTAVRHATKVSADSNGAGVAVSIGARMVFYVVAPIEKKRGKKKGK